MAYGSHIATWLEVQLNNNHEELGWLDQDGKLFKMKWIRGVVPNLAAEWIAHKRSIEDASLTSNAKHKFKMAISNSSGGVVFLWGKEENEAMKRFSLQRSEWRILKLQDRRESNQLPVSTYSLENSIRPSDLMSTTTSEMRALLEGGDLATGSEIGDDYEANVQFVISSLCENRTILSDVPLACNRCRLVAAHPRDYKTPHLVIVPNEEEQRSLAELSRMIIKQLMRPSSEAEAEADILIVCESNGDIHATNQTKCSVFCRVPWLRSTPEPFKLEPDKATLIFSLSEYMYKIRFNTGIILPKVELDIGNDFKMQSDLIVSITSRKGLEIYQQATNQEQVTCPTGLFKNDWPRTNSTTMESVGKSMSDMSVSDEQWFNM